LAQVPDEENGVVADRDGVSLQAPSRPRAKAQAARIDRCMHALREKAAQR
jgi:hypothetical protein